MSLGSLPRGVPSRERATSADHAKLFMLTQADSADRRFFELVESLPIVVYEAHFGSDGAWSYVSQHIERLLGFSVDEWVSNPKLWFERVHADDRELVLAHERTLRTRRPGEPVVTEYRMFSKSGQTVWVRDEAVVVLDARVDRAGRSARRDSMRRMRGVIVDVTERKDLEARLARHAFYDTLTNLPNRALFVDRLDVAVARAARDGTSLGVLLVDIDDFSVVNDTLGHAAGDRLMSEIARRVRKQVRPTDTPARFGGDEFTVLLDGIDGRDEALALAAGISEAISAPIHIADRDLTLTACIGIALDGSGKLAANELISHADIAMYRAKQQGKGRTRVFDPEMGTDAWRRLDLSGELRRAIDERELFVVYQPIVDVTRQEVVACEALVRWDHPTRGVLTPDEFVPFAEGAGLISLIDRYVLNEACQTVARWRSELEAARDLTVAVNVSSRDLRDGDVVRVIEDALEAAHLSASALRIEITESAAVFESEGAANIVEALVALGVQVAIDDFGVGYSGLDNFKRLSVSGVKIDRSFTLDIASDGVDKAIVAAAIAFGRALDLSVVAEGVENVEQLNALLALGCTHIQGYLYSEPLPEAEFRTYLLSGHI